MARGAGKSKARNIEKGLMRSDNNKNPTDGKRKSKACGEIVPLKSAGTVSGGGVISTAETVVTTAAVTPATEDENTSFRDSSTVGCSEMYGFCYLLNDRSHFFVSLSGICGKESDHLADLE